MEGSTDYINAVVVEVSKPAIIFCARTTWQDFLLGTECDFFALLQGINKRENYILTQSPLKETVEDLWNLVKDYNSSTIVMLNQIPTDQVQTISSFSTRDI